MNDLGQIKPEISFFQRGSSDNEHFTSNLRAETQISLEEKELNVSGASYKLWQTIFSSRK